MRRARCPTGRASLMSFALLCCSQFITNIDWFDITSNVCTLSEPERGTLNSDAWCVNGAPNSKCNTNGNVGCLFNTEP